MGKLLPWVRCNNKKRAVVNPLGPLVEVGTLSAILSRRFQGQKERTFSSAHQEEASLAFFALPQGLAIVRKVANRLAINLQNNISAPQPCFVSRAARLHRRNHHPLRSLQPQALRNLRCYCLNRKAELPLFLSRRHHQPLLNLPNPNRQIPKTH